LLFLLTSQETTPDELQARKRLSEESRRKIDEDWHHRPGTPLKVTNIWGKMPNVKNPDPAVPTRFSVRPPHKNTFEALEGDPGTSFHASNIERLKTTKQSHIDNQESPDTLEKERRAQRDTVKLERMRQHLSRVVQCYDLEEFARKQKELKRIEGRANLRQKYVEVNMNMMFSHS
jgi:hypothetical protein